MLIVRFETLCDGVPPQSQSSPPVYVPPPLDLEEAAAEVLEKKDKEGRRCTVCLALGFRQRG
jgi:hypothetical protein